MSPLLPPRASIVFEGDSLTNRRMRPSLDNWAFLRLAAWDGCFGDEIAEWCFCVRPDLAWNFHNAGVGGSNIRDLTGRYAAMVAPHRPHLVILTIGNNDPHQGVGLEEFRELFDAYAVRLREDSGGRLLFLGGFVPCAPLDQDPAVIRRAELSAPYHAIAREVLAARDGLYLDAGAPLAAKARLLRDQSEYHTVYSDGRHLNAVGNTIVAAEVLQALGVLRLA